jgi:hypothetical protein
LGNIAIREGGAVARSNPLRGFWEEGDKQHEKILSHGVELKQNVQDIFFLAFKQNLGACTGGWLVWTSKEYRKCLLCQLSHIYAGVIIESTINYFYQINNCGEKNLVKLSIDF